MKNVPAEKKKEFGLILNEFKQLAESKYEYWKTQTENTDVSENQHQISHCLLIPSH